MSLENFTLPVQALVELYSNQLCPVAEARPELRAGKPDETTATVGQAPPAPAFLGGNRRQVLIWVNDADAVHISSAHLEALTRILAACKLTLDDVAILNNNGNACTWAPVQPQLSPRYCILFDVPPEAAGLPLVFPPYHQQAYNGCQFILSDGLEQISASALLKSKLWLCLKAMFHL